MAVSGRNKNIAMIAPAGGANKDAFYSGLTRLAQYFNVTLDYLPAALKKDPTKSQASFSYLAAEDHERAVLLKQALEDSQVDLLMAIRGGFGTSRLLPILETLPLEKNGKKPVIGFSDITAYHLFINQRGFQSIHGPVLTQLHRLSEEDMRAFTRLVNAGKAPTLTGLQCIVSGEAKGRLLGGNLSMIAHLCGSPYLPSFKDAILLLEDVNEVPYRLDRLLTQLELSGILNQLAGITLGTFIGCDAEQGIQRKQLRGADILEQRLSHLGIPIVAGAPIGHGNRNVAVPLGRQCTINAHSGTLSF